MRTKPWNLGDPDAITTFRGEHRFLSNDFRAPIRLSGILYPTNQHAFAAMMTTAKRARTQIAALATPDEARAVGRSLALRADWEKIKRNVMIVLVAAKFRQHPTLAARLLATGDRPLIDGNTTNDREWGVDLRTGHGLNIVGLVLMGVRTQLRAAERTVA